MGMPSKRPDLQDLLDNILRLRRAERSADAHLQPEIASARALLEEIAGSTVRPAEAARSLGISHASLNRWLDSGEIATVLTPHGRREIPLSELVELVEEVEQARAAGARRPLARVIHERQRRAEEAVDLKRLLPRRRPRSHRVPELQALAYHRLVAERLDEQMVGEARRRLRRRAEEGRIHPHWADEWERILAMPPPEIANEISADTKRARELRQTSPFAGMLTEQERRRLVRAVEERASG